MTDRGSFDCDVLISGGGPTGVTLGLLLSQKGISVIIVEKEADIYPLPRAAHIDHEVVRILQGAGVADPIMATCRQADRYDFLNAAGKILLRFDTGGELGAGGWPPANFIHQPSIEAALRKKLLETPNVELRTECELTEFAATERQVTARCKTPTGQREISAQFLIGADGARSPVREKLDIEFEDQNFDEPWLVVDAIVHDFDRLPKVNLQICDPKRPTTCILMGEGRHRWEFMILPGETPAQVVGDGFVAKLLEPWDVDGAITIERKAVYRFNARVAKTWRKRRVLLAGDAAHQTPPFAGQGMAAGLRDADNLSWKLAAVIQGNVDDSILDSYQSERDPHVRTMIDMAIMMGKTVCITNRWSAFARDMKFRIVRVLGKLPGGAPEFPPIGAGLMLEGSPGAGSYFPQLVAKEKKLDDLLGTGWWLISRDDVGANIDTSAIKIGLLTDPELLSHATELAEWLDDHSANAVLVRPDHYVFGTGEPLQLIQQYHQIISAAPAAKTS